jgi:hypothetical protein
MATNMEAESCEPSICYEQEAGYVMKDWGKEG